MNTEALFTGAPIVTFTAYEGLPSSVCQGVIMEAILRGGFVVTFSACKGVFFSVFYGVFF